MRNGLSLQSPLQRQNGSACFFKTLPAESRKRRDLAMADETIIGLGSDNEALTFGNRAL
jgi:hypothetical protein